MIREIVQEMTPMYIRKLTYGLYDTIQDTVASIITMPWYLKIVPAFFVYFAPLRNTVHLLIAFVFADMFFSILRQVKSAQRARKKNMKKCSLSIAEKFVIFDKVFDRYRLFDSAVKLLAYIILLMLFYSIDAIILKIPLTEIATMRFTWTNALALIIIVSEIISITKHLTEITHNPVFAAIGKFSSKKLDNSLDVNFAESTTEEDEK